MARSAAGAEPSIRPRSSDELVHFPNGHVYEGELKDGKMHGKGVFKARNGNVYDGELKDGKMHGWGTLTFPNGDVYEGEFREGGMHGNGTMKRSSGEVLAWVDGVMLRRLPPVSSVRGASSLSNAHPRTADAKPDSIREHHDGGRKLRSTTSQQRRKERKVTSKLCDHCGVDDYHYKLRTCSACGLALYCSAACQKAAMGSHHRICDIVSELPSRDADRLVLEYDREKRDDLDAGLRYATKYMDNLKHLAIDVKEMAENDRVKLSAKQLSSLFRSKKGALDSVFWMQNRSICVPGISNNGKGAWTEMHGLKQLRLEYLKFDHVQRVHDILCQQSNTLEVLCLHGVEIGWHKAKCRRTFAQAVSTCKHLVKLDLHGFQMIDSDLKIMLQDLPNLRVLDLVRDPDDNHEFTDNTCSLITRKCPGLQELNLTNHNHLSVRGVRKIIEGCVHLRSFISSTSKLSCDQVRSLLDIAPQLLILSLDRMDFSEEEISDIVESTGGKTLVQYSSFSAEGIMAMAKGLSAKSGEKYLGRMNTLQQIWSRRGDPNVTNEWEEWFEG